MPQFKRNFTRRSMSGKGEKKKGVEERLRVKTVGAHIESGCQKRAKRDKHDQFVKKKR